MDGIDVGSFDSKLNDATLDETDDGATVGCADD